MTRSADTPTALFSPATLAAYLDVPIATVYTWNYHRSGPPALHVGRHVRYRRADVEAWLDAQGPAS
jgi:excisionase family DNA binding protein